MIISSKITKTGLGTSRLASLGGALSQPACNHLIKIAFDNNIRVLDTADFYGTGDAERMISKAVAGKRNEFFIITKAGFPVVSLPGWLSPLNQISKKAAQKLNIGQKNFSKTYLINALHKSLKRLKTDSVDAFVLHEPAFGETTDESWEALSYMREKGMAQYTGVSASDHRVITAGIESGQVQIVETPVSLLQGAMVSIPDLCYKHDIPVVANQVLSNANNLLTNHKDKIESVLANYNLMPNDLLKVFIGYAASRPGVKCTITGTKSASHLVANANIHTYADALYNDIKNLNDANNLRPAH